MTRMSREFSLVLVGSGILTAGYFLYPDATQAKEEEAINNQVTGKSGSGSSYHRTGGGFIFIHTGGWGGGSSVRGPASASAGRTNGFGSLGRASAGS